MGRLPETFGGRPITARTPFAIGGYSAAVEAGSPLATSTTISHNGDRPFEIHRFLPRPLGSTEGEEGADLSKYLIQITDYTKSQKFLREPTSIASLLKSGIDASWEFAQPYYLERSEGLTFEITPAPFAALTSLPALEFSVEGFLVNIFPATDRR